MLSELVISNFALIKDVKLELKPGLNILTGETGAGKSIIIKALDMLLGGRASTDYVRYGEDKAIIEGCFNLKDNFLAKEKVDELGLELSDDENIILTREISVNGNNKSRINGRVVTLEMVRGITQYLIDIHGQHEHQSLLNAEDHLRLLDEFGAKDLMEVKVGLINLYSKLQEKKKKLEELNYDERERERRIDLLEFQINEIEEAELKMNEDEELLEERKRLSNAEELSQTIGKAYSQLYQSEFEQSSIIDQVNQLSKEIDSLVKLDNELEEVAENLKSINYDLEDVSFKLRDYHDEIEFNPQRLNLIEERLDIISRLKRKYGDTISEILDYQDTIIKELDNIKNSQIRKEELKENIDKLEEEYLALAKKLSSKRKEMANILEKNISKELKDLSMMQTVFKIDFKERDTYSKDGIDKVEFLISPNPGSKLKPLAKIASGGELSRVMLSLKTITADIDQISTLIFDEIDTGIGGRVGKLVADKLDSLAKNHQIICITHLPQIACMADNHHLIMKKIVNNETETVIHPLKDNARIRELARMLDGSLSETTLDHAEELLKSAINKKRNK
ncbi:DNA repair protein RecN [Orenia marismortui]|uniref:DNA repair protein RecN n=1 Tax=Orenia marismortui TaxID=46469 RepID=UPI0003764E59|nr:DNA repair protein RecN [Orenia marismortui]